MALLSLLFRAAGFRNRIGLLRLDATLSEIHDRSSRITDHPIEGGSMMQDHIARMPRKLTIEGYVTDTPLIGSSFGVQGAYELLDLTWSQGLPTVVISGLHVYPRMAFESLTMPKTLEGALRFSATMKEITLTSAAATTVQGGNSADSSLASGNVTNPRTAANGVNAGQQPTASIPTSSVTGGSAGSSGSSNSSGSLLSRIF
tara:strand:- start:4556 stop:5161 length:606 start_codon:yes stop_codon:yes gene_type:complete